MAQRPPAVCPLGVEMVVARVGERVPEIARSELHPAESCRRDDDRQERVVRHEDPEDPLEVKPREPDRPARFVLVDQHPGDQVPGDDEEDAHAEHPGEPACRLER